MFAYHAPPPPPPIVNNESAAAACINYNYNADNVYALLLQELNQFYSLIQAHKVTQSWQSERWLLVKLLCSQGWGKQA